MELMFLFGQSSAIQLFRDAAKSCPLSPFPGLDFALFYLVPFPLILLPSHQICLGLPSGLHACCLACHT